VPVTLKQQKKVQGIFAKIFAAQLVLQRLAPEFQWTGLGNMLGDFGELLAIRHYGLVKAPAGASGYDAKRPDDKTVQIKTVYAASQIGFRGLADYLLVIKVASDGSWEELYYDKLSLVLPLTKYSKRDNKQVITLEQLKQCPRSESSSPPSPAP